MEAHGKPSNHCFGQPKCQFSIDYVKDFVKKRIVDLLFTLPGTKYDLLLGSIRRPKISAHWNLFGPCNLVRFSENKH